jgi:filamentous hemagglutinin
MHADELKKFKELANGDASKEAKLFAASCALTKCYAEYPEGSETYKNLKAIADVGNSAVYADARQELIQTGMFTYTTGVWSDASLDTLKQVNNTYQVGVRAAGGVEAILGGAGIVGSAIAAPAACLTGVGCVADAYLAYQSTDALYTGSNQLMRGLPQETFTSHTLQNLGLSQEAANYMEMALGLVSGATLAKSVGTTVVKEVTSEVNSGTSKLFDDINLKGISGSGEVGQFLDLADNLAAQATHNANSNIVVLGKYIENSTQSYEQVAKNMGATYFELPKTTWSNTASEYGDDVLWTANKQFLDNQIKQGKEFIFTVDPRKATGFTKDEFNYLMDDKGYKLIEQEGVYRAIQR